MAAACQALLLAWPLAAQADPVREAIDEIGRLLARDAAAVAPGAHRYEIQADASFPCSLVLIERYRFQDKDWIRYYHLQLEDLEPGTLLASRDRRRAIGFRAQVRYPSGQMREFSPQRIHNVRLRLGNPKNAGKIRRLLAGAIRDCRERNGFGD